MVLQEGKERSKLVKCQTGKKKERERERRILKEFTTHNLVIYVADGKKNKMISAMGWRTCTTQAFFPARTIFL